MADVNSAQEILNRTVTLVGESFGCDRVLAYFSPESGVMHADWRASPADSEPLEALFEIRDLLLQATPAPTLFLNDVRRSALSQPLLQKLLAARVLSIGIIPLFIGERSCGWIECHHTLHYYRWRKEDTLILESMSNTCALFLERALVPVTSQVLARGYDDAHQRYTRLAEYGNLIIVHSDAQMRVVDAVGNVKKILGISSSTLQNDSRIWVKVIHPADYRRLSVRILRLKNMHLQINEEIRVINQESGKTFWLLIKGVPTVGEKGEFLGWEGFGLDITGKREAEEELISERRRIEALYEVSRALKILNDPQLVAGDGLRALLRATNSDAGCICRVDRSSTSFDVVANEGVSSDFVLHAPELRRHEGIIWTTIKKREGLIVRDLFAESTIPAEMLRKEGLRSAMFVPIMFEQEVVGVLALFGKRVARYTTSDLDLVAAACTQIGLAIRQAEAYINEKRQADSLAALYTLSHEVSKHLTPRDVSENALPILQAEFACKRMWIGVLNEQGTHIVGQGGFGPGVRGALINVQIELDLRHDFFDDAIRTKQPIVIPEGSPMECSGLNLLMAKLEIGTIVIVPLVSIGRVVGVLVAEPAVPSVFFAQKKLPLLVSMANEIATVVMARRFEGKMAEANKMRMASLLASGVAHNFNNLLQAVMGQASLLDIQLSKDSPLSASTKMILSAAEKGATLIRQLHNFTSDQAYSPQVVAINDTLQESKEIYRSVLGPEIGIEMKLESEAPDVLVDYSQIQQAVTNLLINAKEAIGAKPGGKVKFITTKVNLRSAEIDPDLAPGTYLRLDLEDNGVGMDYEKQSRCFEPFYTTKNVDSDTGLGFGGVGLGLSSAYAIIKKHGGLLTVSSEPGEGATFSIYLPTADRDGVVLDPSPSNSPTGETRGRDLKPEVVVGQSPATSNGSNSHTTDDVLQKPTDTNTRA